MSANQSISNYLINIYHNENYSINEFETILTSHTLRNLNKIINIINSHDNIDINNRTELINKIINNINNIINNNYRIDYDLLKVIYKLLINNNVFSNNETFYTFTLDNLIHILSNTNNILTRDIYLICLITNYTLNYQYNNNNNDDNINNTSNYRNNIINNTIASFINNRRRTHQNDNLDENNLNDYHYININNTSYNPENGGYSGINSINGIVGPNNIYNNNTPYNSENSRYSGINSANGTVSSNNAYENVNITIVFDDEINILSSLLSHIKCPFCRIECERTDWINTNIKNICDICYEDKYLYKSNICNHKMCKHCVDTIP